MTWEFSKRNHGRVRLVVDACVRSAPDERTTLTKLKTIAATATLMSFPALAQTSSGDAAGTTNAADQAQMQMDEATGNVFYNDMKARTLRPESEWSKDWAGLTDAQRA